MANQAFYRKWRSQRFGDLVGQDHVAQTLRNAVRTNRLAHAYVFCGPRGVGKTSAARILAKAVNCPNVDNGEPCATCQMCQAIQEGRAIDILEIDAASNRGIEEIRGIREKVGLAPAAAQYKFYILDEAHMLTTEAFNALLKTLEEPPANTVFVLVTTEARRLPETVLSRCQRLDFRRISVTDSVSRLAFVCQQEGITPEAGVLELLAQNASGSLRDAEGVLDQIVSYAGTEPTLVAVRSILGTAGPDAAITLLNQVLSNDVARAIRSVNDLVDQGADPRQIAVDIVETLRNILLLRTSEGLVDLINASTEVLPSLKDLARGLAPTQIVELIRIFTPGPVNRIGIRPQLPLEMSLVEAHLFLVAPPSTTSTQPVSSPPIAPPRPAPAPARRGSSEAPVARSMAPDTVSTSSTQAAPMAHSPAMHQPVDQEIPPAPPVSSTEVVETSDEGEAGILWHDAVQRWSEILDACGTLNRSVQALLRSARPIGGDGSSIVLGFPYEFHRERIEDQKNRGIVEDAIGRVLGQIPHVRCALVTREALASSDPFQAVVDDPLIKAAVALGARVRTVTEESAEEK